MGMSYFSIFDNKVNFSILLSLNKTGKIPSVFLEGEFVKMLCDSKFYKEAIALQETIVQQTESERELFILVKILTEISPAEEDAIKENFEVILLSQYYNY